MPHTHPDSEQALENVTMALFAQLGWQTASCFEEVIGPNGTLGRETTSQVVLIPRLRAALAKLNPELPSEAISLAIEELTRDRSAMSAANANREVYQLLKDGVKVSFADGSLAPRDSVGFLAEVGRRSTWLGDFCFQVGQAALIARSEFERCPYSF